MIQLIAANTAHVGYYYINTNNTPQWIAWDKQFLTPGQDYPQLSSRTTFLFRVSMKTLVLLSLIIPGLMAEADLQHPGQAISELGPVKATSPGPDHSSGVQALPCGAVDTLEYGQFAVLETPEFPDKKYPNDFHCQWRVEVPAMSQVLLSCDYFWLKYGDFFSFGGENYYGYSTGFSGLALDHEDDISILAFNFTTNGWKRARGFRYIDCLDRENMLI